MSENSTIPCPNCDDEYQRLSQHWALGSCGYPELSEYHKEVFTGLLMGDGCIAEHQSDTPYFVIAMTNEGFLNWLSDEMGWMMYGSRLSKTAEESSENSSGIMSLEDADPKNFSDVYRIQTPCHPWFKELASWYETGKKTFPEDITLTPTIVKMWYVSDGTLRQRDPNPSVHITSVNEAERAEWLCELFYELGFNPSYVGDNISFTVADSKKFLEWIGDPVPGFEYKWDEIIVGGETPWRERDNLYELYVAQEMSLAEVGEELGCSADTVSKWLRHHGITVRTKGGKYV